jgi:hypothetical protein
MLAQYLLAAAVLAVALTGIAGPSFIAAYRWWFWGGKLLNDRLGPKPLARKRRL